jgi:hypothetical protein
VINAKSITGILKGFQSRRGGVQLDLFGDYSTVPLEQYAYVRRKTYNGQSRTVLLCIDDHHLKFADLTGDHAFVVDFCSRLGLDWTAIYFKLHEINFRVKNGRIDEEKELTHFDLVLRPNQAIYVEDINETVLYEYEKMSERKDLLSRPLPIAELRLGNRYKTDDLQTRSQIREFETFLDELSDELPDGVISFDQLTSNPFGERVAQIFQLPTNPKGRYKFGKLKKMYQQIDMFPSDKATELHTYQGIWYDSENRYLVGEPDGIKQKQDKANKVRQFTLLSGNAPIDIQLLLSMTGVAFIRPKRYTVLPYPFNLIDMFAEIQAQAD